MKEEDGVEEWHYDQLVSYVKLFEKGIVLGFYKLVLFF